MQKAEMVNEIEQYIETIDCEVIRTYGVTHGVGYDLHITLNDAIRLNAHATNVSWDLVGHRKADNDYCQYTGKNDVYKEAVIDYWVSGEAIQYYLERLTKDQLFEIMLAVTT